MSGLKSDHKTDLSAIYRLEFYKKQKKWKLSHDTKKPNQKTPISKKILDRTYSIDSLTDEKHTLLNDGFFVPPDEVVPNYEELDQEPLPQLLKQTETPTNILDSAEDFQEDISPTQEQYMWLEPERDEQIWSNAVQEYEVPLWQDAIDQDPYYVGTRGDDWGLANGTDWPAHPPDMVQQQWLHDHDEVINQVEPWVGEPHLPPDDSATCLHSRNIETENQDSVGNYTEFARGAHLAPHSSEIELALDSCNCTSDRTCSSLGRVSEGELRARADAHAAALSALFAEILLRNNLKMSNTTTCLHCPSHRSALNPLTVGGESLLSIGTAGGRGRGRLREAQPLIRIGMGRPYRCT